MTTMRKEVLESLDNLIDEEAAVLANQVLNNGLECWIGMDDSGFNIMHYLSDNSVEWFEMATPPKKYTSLESVLDDCIHQWAQDKSKKLASLLRKYADKIEDCSTKP